MDNKAPRKPLTPTQRTATSAFWTRVAKAHDQHGQTREADAARDHAKVVKEGS